MPAPTIARRRFLQALGSVPFLWPLANRVLASDGRRPLKRLVLFMQNNGTQQLNFWPRETFNSRILDPLLGDPQIAQRTNLIRGVFVPRDSHGTDSNEHDMGFARMFTGEPLFNIAGKPWGGGPSVDQIVARQWRTETLTTAIVTSAVEPHPKPGFDHRKSFIYLDAGQHKLPLLDPFVVYQQLLPAVVGDESVRQRLRMRRSVLDTVAGNLGDLNAVLGPQERHKLDRHLTSIREVEQRLTRTLEENPSQCPSPNRPRDYTHEAPDLLLNNEAALPEIVALMIDLGALALRCGIVPIVTVQFGYGGGKWRFAWEGIDMNCHDDVAHHDTSDAGGNPINTERVVRMNHYYASQVARMARALQEAPDGDGTVLDNSLIVWSNEQGRGDHNQRNIPVVMIGRAGGAIPLGGRMIDDGTHPFNKIGCTILNAMGIPAAGFGDVPACGPFPIM